MLSVDQITKIVSDEFGRLGFCYEIVALDDLGDGAFIAYEVISTKYTWPPNVRVIFHGDGRLLVRCNGYDYSEEGLRHSLSGFKIIEPDGDTFCNLVISVYNRIKAVNALEKLLC